MDTPASWRRTAEGPHKKAGLQTNGLVATYFQNTERRWRWVEEKRSTSLQTAPNDGIDNKQHITVSNAKNTGNDDFKIVYSFSHYNFLFVKCRLIFTERENQIPRIITVGLQEISTPLSRKGTPESRRQEKMITLHLVGSKVSSCARHHNCILSKYPEVSYKPGLHQDQKRTRRYRLHEQSSEPQPPAHLKYRAYTGCFTTRPTNFKGW